MSESTKLSDIWTNFHAKQALRAAVEHDNLFHGCNPESPQSFASRDRGIKMLLRLGHIEMVGNGYAKLTEEGQKAYKR